PRAFSHPTRLRATQLHPADARIMPEKTITAAGKQKGNGDLRIAMREFEHAAFLVKQAMTPLTQAVNALVVESWEVGLARKQIATHSLERSRRRSIRARGNFFDQRLFAPCFKKTDATGFGVNHRREFAADNARGVATKRNPKRTFFRSEQAPVTQGH